MELTINGRLFKFIPLSTFRHDWGLPQDFGISYFEQKNWPVGQLDESSRSLAVVKQRVLAAVPIAITFVELLSQAQYLAAVFRHELEEANQHIGLREVEIDFAVDGFQNVLHDVVYRLVELKQLSGGDLAQIRQQFDFAALYQAWLDASTRILATPHTYVHNGTPFEIRVIYSAYGRIGLAIQVENETYYVLDPTLACPAANFMENLCRKTAYALCRALT